MSWFEYGKPKRRSLRKGVWLRVRDLPGDVRLKIRALLKKNERITWVAVQEIRPKGQVLLECWAHVPKESMNRHIVVHVLVDENPEWICEGDLGRGYKGD